MAKGRPEISLLHKKKQIPRDAARLDLLGTLEVIQNLLGNLGILFFKGNG